MAQVHLEYSINIDDDIQVTSQSTKRPEIAKMLLEKVDKIDADEKEQKIKAQSTDRPERLEIRQALVEKDDKIDAVKTTQETVDGTGWRAVILLLLGAAILIGVHRMWKNPVPIKRLLGAAG